MMSSVSAVTFAAFTPCKTVKVIYFKMKFNQKNQPLLVGKGNITPVPNYYTAYCSVTKARLCEQLAYRVASRHRTSGSRAQNLLIARPIPTSKPHTVNAFVSDGSPQFSHVFLQFTHVFL